MMSPLVRAVFVIGLLFPLAACGGGGTDRRDTATPDMTAPTLRSVEIQTVEYPKAETWEELQQYISERRARIASFAQQEPDAMLSAGVTFATEFTREEAEALVQDYGVFLLNADYQAGGAGGGGAAFGDGGFATLEARQPYHDGSFRITYMSGQATAADWARLSSDGRVALVYADFSIDIATGAVPTETLFKAPDSIFSLYQDLRP